MIKFLLTPFLLITSTVLVSLDINHIPTFVFLYSLFIIFGDLLLPRDHEVYDDDNKQLFDFFVMLPLPLLLIYLFVSSNVFYDKYLLNELSYYSVIGNIINLGLMLATAGTNAGHELIHRAKNSIQQKVGYWLLALNFDTAFVIEHLHGHHKFIGTYDDPATVHSSPECCVPDDASWTLTCSDSYGDGRFGISRLHWDHGIPKGEMRP